MTRFDTVLVANRGEIAVRVIRSARAAGYRTVAVHSDADAGAPHVAAADVAVRIGPAPSTRGYLDGDAVLAAAAATGAGAIHPGYGFLSENAAFARACAEAGVVFVGPPPEAIEAMGDKALAKRRMAAAGVPVLPGYQGDDQSEDRLAREADQLGAPLLIKAAAGGGGKGMRLVRDLATFADDLAAARREARASFGDDAVLLERAVLASRHVEIQVLADEHGTVIALGERDCSVQRRHQKVVEEAPSPAVGDRLRERMQQAAVAAARDVGYVGAGTVEFLLAAPGPATGGGDLADGDVDDRFHFLEMNTRLQVEHPVTELVTGLDLVDLQLRVAQGERLPLSQGDVALDGHAIEVRLYAEDADAEYRPQTGRVRRFAVPTGPGVRVDAGVVDGSEVTTHYDPMLAKIVAHGATREEARRRLAEVIDRTVALGVTTNRAFLARVLRDPRFVDGGPTTAFLDEPPTATHDDVADALVVAGVLHLAREHHAVQRSPSLGGWSSSARRTSHQLLRGIGADDHRVEVVRDSGGLVVRIGEREATVAGTAWAPVVDGRRVDLDAHVLDGDRVLVRLPHRDLTVDDVLLAAPGDAVAAGAGVLVAPMHGVVTAVEVAVETTVVAGQRVVAIEAMKMEHVLVADVDGVVEEVATVGDQVGTDDVLARIAPADEAGEGDTDAVGDHRGDRGGDA